MSIGWCMCVNFIIGIVLFIPIVLIFEKIHYRKYGEELCREALKNYNEHNTDIIYAGYKNPKRALAISAIMTLFLWEILIPVALDLMHQAIVELYNARNKP